MAGILDRVSQIVRANLNDIVDRAEDPEKMLKQIIIDMRNQLVLVKTQVAMAMADEHKLHQRYVSNEQQVVRWQEEAALAVANRDDALAKQALARSNSYAEIALGFQQQWQDQQKQVALLKDGLAKLVAKSEEAERKKDLLIAMSRRAKAQQRVQEAMIGIHQASTFDAFARLEDKVADQQARASAMSELVGDDIEDRLAALERDADLDGQLAALKQRIGTPSA